MAQKTVMTVELFNAVTVAAGGVLRSVPIEIAKWGLDGFFSLHVTVFSGSGTAQIEYELSNDDNTDGAAVWVTPSSASDIVTAHTDASGPGSDGNDLYSFSPETARYMRIKVTETGGAQTITITAVLALQ